MVIWSMKWNNVQVPDTIRITQQLTAVYVTIYPLYVWSALKFATSFQTLSFEAGRVLLSLYFTWENLDVETLADMLRLTGAKRPTQDLNQRFSSLCSFHLTVLCLGIAGLPKLSSLASLPLTCGELSCVAKRSCPKGNRGCGKLVDGDHVYSRWLTSTSELPPWPPLQIKMFNQFSPSLLNILHQSHFPSFNMNVNIVPTPLSLGTFISTFSSFFPFDNTI